MIWWFAYSTWWLSIATLNNQIVSDQHQSTYSTINQEQYLITSVLTKQQKTHMLNIYQYSNNDVAIYIYNIIIEHDLGMSWSKNMSSSYIKSGEPNLNHLPAAPLYFATRLPQALLHSFQIPPIFCPCLRWDLDGWNPKNLNRMPSKNGRVPWQTVQVAEGTSSINIGISSKKHWWYSQHESRLNGHPVNEDL